MAATLARRNSRLIVWNHFPLDGFYDCLGVRDGELSDFEVRVDLNRNGGSVHVHSEQPWQPVALHTLLTADEPFDVIKLVEKVTAWPMGRRATTPRSLTYRVIAQVLQSQVDDRHRWDARLVVPREMWGYNASYPEPNVLDGFAEGREMLATLSPGRTKFHPWENLWVIFRDEQPVAVLDTDGRIVIGNRPIASMMPIYLQNGRRIAPVIAQTLAAVLP
ncbi:hypothetical protein [Agrococcus sp. ARC_14]|uniref:TY-Chap2 family putative peptide chaperone n=1 Tax=Agrococcus sp. ARC_14 TaxID=2919927 RepID=UPI001F050713|nr:hypothetical protein [Agrococcus sp. ARC_14]MCH1883958.1 hypothetical protein [Agrococcus sp. ARC_14]